MRRLLRFLLWMLAALGLLAVAAAALLWWLVATTTGSDWLLQQALGRVPGTLEASAVDGNLLGPLTLGEIHYATEPTPDGTLKASAERIEIAWRPWDLLHRRLQIDHIEVSGLTLDLPPSEEPIELVDIHLSIPVLLKSLVLYDVRLRLAGEPDLTLDRLSLSATAAGDTVEVLEMAIETAQASIEGSGTVTTSGHYPLDLNVTWTVPIDEHLALAGSGQVTGDMTDLLIDQRLTSPAPIPFQGRVLTPLDVPSFVFSAQFTDFDPHALDAALPALLLNGAIDFEGVPQDYRLAGEIDLSSSPPSSGEAEPATEAQVGWAQGHWLFDGHGDEGRFTLDRLVVTAGGGEVQATGELAWDPELAWDLEVHAAAADPSLLLPDWPGRIDFAGDTNGRLTPDGPHFTVTVTELTGELRGYAISGGLQMAIAPDSIALELLQLTSGETHLQANGHFDDDWDLDWEFASGDLIAVHPRIGGRLRAEGSIKGPRAAPRARFRLDSDSLSLDQLAVDSLSASADVDLGERGSVQLTATAKGLSDGSLEIESLQLELDGTRDEHRLDLVAVTSAGTLHGRAQGSLIGEIDAIDSLAWSGEMDRLDLDSTDLGNWRLEAAMPLSAATESLNIGWTCWRSNPSGHACLEAGWAATEGWRSTGSLASLPLQLFKPLLPAILALDGNLTAEYTAAADSEGRLTLDLTAESTGTARLLDDQGLGQERPFSVRLSQARIDADGTHLEADLSVAESRMQLALTLPGYRSLALPPDEQQIEGSLTGGIEDISAFEPFLLGVRDLQGSIDLNGRFSGPIATPRVDGAVTLHAALGLPALGVTLSEVEISATGDDTGQYQLSGMVTSGDGSQVRISGSGPVSPEGDRPTVVRLEGESFEIVNRPEARIWVSPDLEVRVTREGVVITGDVAVPTAQIELVQPDRTAVAVSDDVVIRGGPEAPVQGVPKTTADIRLSLGDAVAIRADSFRALLGGSLQIVQKEGRAPTATGTLILRQGSYRGYNQDLRIDDGRILFSGGAIDNPAFDISAYRRARDGVVAGIHLRGTVDSPQVSLYSTPHLPEPEILSYIMRGKGSSQTGVSNEMSDAAASLGLAQSTAVLNSLGLKNVSLESDGSIDEAAIVLGTYLAPNFYVSYGVGIFEQVNTLRMRYEMSDRWMLEADSSQEGSGADISFTFEK